MKVPEVPAVSDSVEDTADWMEWTALRKAPDPMSVRDFVTALKIASTADVEEAGEQQDEAIYEPKAEEALNECARRRQVVGDRYPFDIGTNSLTVSRDADTNVYRFLLLLSLRSLHSNSGARAFEETCATAAGAYLGAQPFVQSRVFGFPRRVLPKSFGTALDKLCVELGEGGGHKARPTSPDQKDAKLDIVVWKDFTDRKSGKLIAFGQCATGHDWCGKIYELPPTHKWTGFWMKDPPRVDPVRFFFVPCVVSTKEWEHICQFAGILFDRLRIVDLVGTVTDGVAKWSAKGLEKLRAATDRLKKQTAALVTVPIPAPAAAPAPNP